MATLQERGLDATVAFLERAGIRVVEKNYKTKAGVIPIVAVDDCTLVRVRFNVRPAGESPKADGLLAPSAPTIRKYHKQMREWVEANVPAGTPIKLRFDDVSLLVIAEDRALLRHHRGAYE